MDNINYTTFNSTDKIYKYTIKINNAVFNPAYKFENCDRELQCEYFPMMFCKIINLYDGIMNIGSNGSAVSNNSISSQSVSIITYVEKDFSTLLDLENYKEVESCCLSMTLQSYEVADLKFRFRIWETYKEIKKQVLVPVEGYPKILYSPILPKYGYISGNSSWNDCDKNVLQYIRDSLPDYNEMKNSKFFELMFNNKPLFTFSCHSPYYQL
jgi:hypothetical protein